MMPGPCTISVASNAEAVRRFFAILAADLPRAVEIHGDDRITWTLPPTVPGGARPWEGKPAVMKFLGRMQAGFAPNSMHIEVREMVEAGTRFALRVRITALSAGGTPYENEYAFFVSCENGLITEVIEYVDSARVLQIFG